MTQIFNILFAEKRCFKVFYLTDTGRRWNHAGASIRDRVTSGFDIPVNSTAHLAALAGQGKLPEKMMITIHPQRWHDNSIPWAKELISQNIKNWVKRWIVKRRGG